MSCCERTVVQKVPSVGQAHRERTLFQKEREVRQGGL